MYSKQALMYLFKRMFTFICGNRLGCTTNADPVNEPFNRSKKNLNQTASDVETKHSEHDSNNSFPWDEVDTLVIYAAHSFDDKPDKSFPSIKFSNYKEEECGIISAEPVPYLTVLETFDMEDEMFKWTLGSKNLTDSNNADEASEWVTQKIREGWTHFMIGLEPEKYAGDSYKWAASEEMGLTFDE